MTASLSLQYPTFWLDVTSRFPEVPTDQAAIFAYAILSRLAYVLFVGIALRREERDQIYTRRFGPVEGFRRFRRMAALVMYNDALALILLCLLTPGSLTLAVPRSVAIAMGAVLAVLGLGIKLWAARTLGGQAYYWYNFFDPAAAGDGPVSSGPYRFASNPMYTIGYLQTYGLALIVGSLPGLVAAAFAHVAILAFYFLVEKPHFQRLHAP